MASIDSMTYLVTETQATSPVSKLRGELLGVYGVNYTKFLNKPGYLTLTLRMNNPLMNPETILDLTIPLKRAIWVYVNGGANWGGFIIARTYSSEAGTMQVNAVTFDGWYDQVSFDRNEFNVNDVPGRVLQNCWTAALGSNFVWYVYDQWPKELHMPAMPPAFGTVIRMKIPSTSHKLFRAAFDDCIAAGAEYRLRFDGNLDVGVARAAIPEIGNSTDESAMVGKSSSEITEVFDYPGSITRYWWPESCAASQPVAHYVRHYGRAGDGVEIDHASTTTDGVPPTDTILTSRQVAIRNAATNMDGLNMAAPNYINYRPPMVQPTFEIDITGTLVSWPYGIDVGDYFRYAINDPFRFPNTRIGHSRLAGWSFTPPSEDGPAQLGLTLTDQRTTVTQSGE